MFDHFSGVWMEGRKEDTIKGGECGLEMMMVKVYI